MKQSDAKRLLAFSSIGQVGYIVFGLGCALLLSGVESEPARFLALVAMIGAVYHVLNHAIFKGLLFLSSGSVLYATGTRDLNRLGGLLGLMPFTAVLAGIASLSISGVPPLSGFASKWTLVSAALLGGKEYWVLVPAGIVALFTSAVTLACYVKFFGMTFTSAGVEWTLDRPVREVPRVMLSAKALLGLLCIVQGLFPLACYRALSGLFESAPPLQNARLEVGLGTNWGGLTVGVPGFDGVSAAAMPFGLALILGAAVALAAYLRRSAHARDRQVATWLCGYQELNNNNRYLDRNLFAALRQLLRWTGGNPRKGEDR